MFSFKTLYLPVLLFAGFSLISCNSKKGNNMSDSPVLAVDSTNLKLKFSETVFSIPSPSLTLYLLKDCHLEFNPSVISPIQKTERYATTFRKSLIFGMWGADICYLNLYNQKDRAIHYFENLKVVMDELNISKSIPSSFLSGIEDNFGNNDSVLIMLSDLFRKSDEYLKFNDRQDVSSLIIAGGWIESISFLSKLYQQTRDKRIFTLMLYQKNVVDNLIKILSPLYKKTSEYTELIDDLTEIAYSFDVVDVNEVFTGVDSVSNFYYIKNNTSYNLTGSNLDNFGKLIEKLRSKYLD
jgi:hypothetical protein